LQRMQKEQPDEFGTRELERAQVITFKDRIYVPQALRDRIVAWYHDYLSHPGKVRMQNTLASTLYWPNMEKTIYSYVKKCPTCQRCKGPRKAYGKLPMKIWDNPKPWQRVDVDLIGPMKIKTPSQEVELRALTMIDPATGWFEVKDVVSPSAEDCMAAFDDVWLSRYPRPEYLGYDGGSEYKNVFNDMRVNYGLSKSQSTAYNPQSNGVIERVHQVLNNCIRTYEMEERELDERDPFGPFLAAAAFAIQSTSTQCYELVLPNWFSAETCYCPSSSKPTGHLFTRINNDRL
jgi:transposase InsO family protein